MSTDTTVSPVEIDTQLSDLYEKSIKVRQDAEQVMHSLHYAVGDRKVKHGRRTAWGLSDGEVLEAIDADDFEPVSMYAWSFADTLARYRDLEAQLVAIAEKSAALEAVYRQHGWSRFFLVQNTNGHIHSSMDCSTCYHDTRFGWLPALSGLTEAEAVAAHGSILCTVCFPSAPVEWTNGHEKAAEAKAAERCPGSGQYVQVNDWQAKYMRCPECGTNVSRTSTGKTRAHKAAS